MTMQFCDLVVFWSHDSGGSLDYGIGVRKQFGDFVNILKKNFERKKGD